MQLQTKTVRQGINKAYLKVSVKRADLDHFKASAITYLNNLEQAEGESEEHLKGYLRDFLQDSFYSKEERLVNTSNRIDLGIYSGKTKSSTLEVIFEAKQPGNTSEMITKDNTNAKALHEALLYYFEEREAGNEDLKQVVVTNYSEFFLFDAQEIERNFYSKKSLVKTFRQWKTDQKVSSNTKFMYSSFEEFIHDSDANLNAVYVDLSAEKKRLENPPSETDDKKLIPLYKLFSPEHLVKKTFANDSNSLDKRFYNELLHILGLQEVKEKGSRLIQRLPQKERQRGSLIENTIEILRYDQHMNEVREAKVQYGEDEDDQLFGVALELVITWMNRVLFLKLMEAQLLAYHQQDNHFRFLSFASIDEYDELNKLFFRVLALRNEERPASVQKRFGHIPYLNSSLFDSTKLEKTTIQISGLDDKAEIDIYSRSVLKKGANPPKEKLKTLDYLLRFLDAYNFSAETSGGIQTEDKALINASVLGLIFEKINGYKDGSFFTPGFITEYMARETLRKSVVDKFNEKFGWECSEFEGLKRKMETVALKEANEVVNSITICDPAVGSGHFLVSCLNELIAIKSELKILTDHEGKYISRLDISVENDELAVELEGELFEYKLKHDWKNGNVVRKPAGAERQRVQMALFHEKKFLIENCLFGVDINPNSVKICRLRLWIELLKHAYYRADDDYTELEVLPNIDINIKQGNSLVSRFGLEEDLSSIFKKSEHSLDDYKEAVKAYRETRDRSEKQRLQQLINDIKAEYSESLLNNKPINKKLSKARGRLDLMQNEDLFGEGKATKKELKQQEKKVAKLEEQKAEEEAGAFYREAFEWRFEFPEVLDEEGKYKGFDVVIGNPPYKMIQPHNTPEKELEVMRNNYPIADFKIDLYHLFFQLSEKLIGKKRLINFIAPSSLLNNVYASSLRSFLIDRLKLIRVMVSEEQVFEDADVHTALYFLRKEREGNYLIEISTNQNEIISEKGEFDVIDSQTFNSLIGKVWNLKINESNKSLIEKLTNESNVKYLGDIGRINRGLISGNRSKYFSDSKESDKHKPILVGSDILRYKYKSPSEFILFERPKSAGGSWDEDMHLAPHKICIRQIGKEPTACFLDKPYAVTGNIFTVMLKNQSQEKITLGIINSKLIHYYWSIMFYDYKRTFPQVAIFSLNQIPIIDFKRKSATTINGYVNQILTTKKENPDADTRELEAEIDRLVYELYGLSEEEIAIVEESVG